MDTDPRTDRRSARGYAYTLQWEVPDASQTDEYQLQLIDHEGDEHLFDAPQVGLATASASETLVRATITAAQTRLLPAGAAKYVLGRKLAAGPTAGQWVALMAGSITFTETLLAAEV